MRSTKTTLERLVAVSRVILAWEATWRAISIVGAIVALFLAVSWFGLWSAMPAGLRPVGVALFIASIGLAVAREIRAARTTRTDALRRLDRTSEDPHATASSLDDEAVNAGDPTAAALWRVHKSRLLAKIENMRVAPPSPRAIESDSRGLRAGAVLLALVGLVYAGADRGARISAAFMWSGDLGSADGARIDAWIDPPAYTGKPPIVISGARQDSSATGPHRYLAPIGSTIVVRSAGETSPNVLVDGALTPEPAKADSTPEPKREGLTRRFTLKGVGRLTIGDQSYDLDAIPDRPPTVELIEQPRANLRGSLTLQYRTDDDYGVSSLEARVADPEIEGRAVADKPLVDAPRPPLALPPGANGIGETHATVDVSESPWAGARVSLTLLARDDSGNEGASAPISIFLPQRPFSKPLARALVEQRRNLVLEPRRRARVLAALNGLMLEPEKFDVNSGVYLGLRVAASGISQARTNDALLNVADLLWSMALRIEDGGASDAEKELRAAEKDLRDALQRNAQEEEIARLTQALRQAMDKFLAEMAKRQPDQRGRTSENPGARSRSVSRDDLQKMLDRMESMARSGDSASARDMLDQLQNMLENLRTARRPGQGDRAAQQAQRALRDMDQLMRDQQQLRDDTYRDGRSEQQEQQSRSQPRGANRDRSGQNGRRPDSSAKLGKNLRQRQSDLENRLGELQNQLGKQSGKQLGAAQEAMKDAEGELGQGGDRDKAVDAQGRALDAMRNGADQLAKRMRGQGQPSDQMGDEEGQQSSEADGGERDDADPLGRPNARSRRYDPNARYDPLGSAPALRAQRVLEELRRRLGDVSRPQEELDYLDRLIRRY